jgi:hypothetical protein
MRLALEPGAPVRIRHQGIRQYLHDDEAAESRVAGPIDLAHPAGPERAHDLIRSHACPGRQHSMVSPAHASSRLRKRSRRYGTARWSARSSARIIRRGAGRTAPRHRGIEWIALAARPRHAGTVRLRRGVFGGDFIGSVPAAASEEGGGGDHVRRSAANQRAIAIHAAASVRPKNRR